MWGFLSWKKRIIYSHMTIFQMLVLLWNFDILSVFTHRSHPLQFSVLFVIFCHVTVPLHVLGKSTLIRNYKLYAYHCDAHVFLSTHTKTVILILRYTIQKFPVAENVLCCTEIVQCIANLFWLTSFLRGRREGSCFEAAKV